MRRGSIFGVLVAVAAALAIPLVATADHKPGHDRPPGSRDLTIAVSQNPVPYPKLITITGKLRGSNVAGKPVELEHNPYPYPALRRLGRTTTNDKGEYRFVVRPGSHTFYRTVAPPGAESAEVLVRSRMQISRRVSDRTPRRGQVVTFSGAVVPAHDGRTVYIQRYTRERPRWRTVATTRLQDAGAERPNHSVYSRKLRIRRKGTFRTIVRRDDDHLWNRSRGIRLAVR